MQARPRSLRLAALAASLAVAAVGRPATAQEGSSAALAEKLYVEGQQLMRAGDPESLKQACEKLAASQRLDPGLGTLLNLALCHERTDRTALAWSEYMEAAAQAAHARDAERERFARDHVSALEPKLRRIAVDVSPRVAGAQVTLDAQPLPEAVALSEMPVDPGRHTIEVTAPGKKRWSRAIDVTPDAPLTRVPVQLEDEDVPVARPAAASLPFPAPVPVAPETGGASRTPAWIAIGVGGAAGVAALVLVLRASALKAQSDDEAGRAVQAQQGGDAATHDTLKAQADSDYASAQGNQTAAIVSGLVAVAGVTTGVVLLTTSGPKRAAGSQAGPRVRLSGAGIGLEGSW